MTLHLEGQLDLFDLLADLEPKPEPPNVAGLTGWTFFEADPDKLDAIWQAWAEVYSQRTHREWKKFPGWHESTTGRNAFQDSLHRSFTYWADVECPHWRETTVQQRENGYCQCVGSNGMLYRIYCAGCDWWTPTLGGENLAAESYLDHCWPGWQELPVLEGKDGKYTLPAGYPEDWQTPGSPIRDCRGRTKFSTRHVPGGSPFGGYRVGVTQDCEKHQ